jgi:transposase
MDTRMTKRRNFSDKFKAAVALEALRGDKTVQEIAAKRQLHPTQVSTWKRQAIEGMAGVFSDKVKKAENKDGDINYLHVPLPGNTCLHVREERLVSWWWRMVRGLTRPHWGHGPTSFVTRAKGRLFRQGEFTGVSPLKRREMICHPAVDPSGSMRGRKENTDLSLTRQCKLLKISRSSIYYTPVGMNAETLKSG